MSELIQNVGLMLRLNICTKIMITQNILPKISRPSHDIVVILSKVRPGIEQRGKS